MPDRREFLKRAGAGFGMLALADLFGASPATAGTIGPHHVPTARAVISLFMAGGPSGVDLFDPKPELTNRDGQPMPLPPGETIDAFFGDPGPLLASPFRFARHGESGQWLSELLPHLAGVVDELAIVRSMQGGSNNHAPALYQMNTGQARPGSPSLGSWSVYGLGTENANLPAFVVLCDPRGGPIGGAANWGAGYMPATFAGTPLRPDGPPLLDLVPPPGEPPGSQRAKLDLLGDLDRAHLADHPGEAELAARIESYELAFRMQAEAPEAVDLSRESGATRRLYGLDHPVTASFGRRLLIARRLVERGVRFVQVFSGSGENDDNWDAHRDLVANHRTHCAATDLPVAGLIRDLKARGLLDEVLVTWGGEFGRMPVSQAKIGRDHNPHGFTWWLAGGGVRPGVAYGATDDFGYRAAVDPVSIRDLHATTLHLLGLDHTELTYLHAGRHTRLTDVGGRVVERLLRRAPGQDSAVQTSS